MNFSRYHRQSLLPQIGPEGQRRLASARVLLVGCGALGTTIAEQLTRAGLGFLRIVDRDIVELTNLQRQVLFDEADVAAATPKAVAAANRLSRVNGDVRIDPVVADVHAGNIEEHIATADGNPSERHGQVYSLTRGNRAEVSPTSLATSATANGVPLPIPPNPMLRSPTFDLLIDGTDNVETRYLLNDVAVKHGIPWIYGACVGVEGRVMPVRPGVTPCLRCVFPDPPGPGELPTCDTSGVLGAAAAVVAAMQATVAIQLLVAATPPNQLTRIDLWRGRLGATPLDDARRPDCVCCGGRQFEFLDAPAGAGSSTSLCGRNAVQVRPAAARRFDLEAVTRRLSQVTYIRQTPYLLKCRLPESAEIALTLFPDGRAIVHGTSDVVRARTLYARWIGS